MADEQPLISKAAQTAGRVAAELERDRADLATQSRWADGEQAAAAAAVAARKVLAELQSSLRGGCDE